MSIETAQIVLVSISAAAVLVWLTGLQFLVNSARQGQGDSVAGSTEIDGQPAELAAKAAALLAKGDRLTLGPVKITEKSDHCVVFERLEAAAANHPGRWFQRGAIHFTAVANGRSRVEWLAELASRSWLLKLGVLFQVLGLIALAGGGWAIFTFVVAAADPAVRWQTIQMVQVVHFLWPPFLFGGLYRRGTRAVAAQFEALASNLPYHE